MSTIKKLTATSMNAAEITKVFPMTALEHFIILQHLYEGVPAGSEEGARRRKDLYQVIAQDWDWAKFEESGGLKPAHFEDLVERTLTKSQLKYLQEFSSNLSGQLVGKFAMATLDVADRVHFILTA